MRISRRAGNARHDVIQSNLRQNRDAVPLSFTVGRELITTADQLLPQQLRQCVVGELGLLQARHVGLPLVQPWQESRYTLLDRIHIPCGQPHEPTLAGDYASEATMRSGRW